MHRNYYLFSRISFDLIAFGSNFYSAKVHSYGLAALQTRNNIIPAEYCNYACNLVKYKKTKNLEYAKIPQKSTMIINIMCKHTMNVLLD